MIPYLIQALQTLVARKCKNDFLSGGPVYDLDDSTSRAIKSLLAVRA